MDNGAPAFTTGDFGEYLDAMERFQKHYEGVFDFIEAHDQDPAANEAHHHLLQMSIANSDLKELFYQALKSQPRSAHLISGDYYASLEDMKQELDGLGFADEE